MKNLNKNPKPVLVKENPDQAQYKMLNYFDEEAVAFGYVGDKFKIQSNEYDKIVIHPILFKGQSAKFSGRLWRRTKFISFWGVYPTAEELLKIIEDIKRYSGIIIDDEWDIEIPADEQNGMRLAPNTVDILLSKNNKTNPSTPTSVISVGDYLQMYSKKRAPVGDVQTTHILSPVSKTQKTVPPGMGSRKSHGGLTSWQADELRDIAENYKGKTMTKEQLKQLIRENIYKVLREEDEPDNNSEENEKPKLTDKTDKSRIKKFIDKYEKNTNLLIDISDYSSDVEKGAELLNWFLSKFNGATSKSENVKQMFSKVLSDIGADETTEEPTEETPPAEEPAPEATPAAPQATPAVTPAPATGTPPTPDQITEKKKIEKYIESVILEVLKRRKK